MGTLPQLIAEDMALLDRVLADLVANSEAAAALVIDKGGFLIAACGDKEHFDFTTIAALASGAFMANQTIAQLIHEQHFHSMYQQGETYSLFVLNVDECCLLVKIFPAAISAGAVKYFGMAAAALIARQIRTALERDPSRGIDLSVLNMADTSSVFQRKPGPD